MSDTTLIAIIFSIGFFLESIFGFGGMLISLSILSFFIDIKEIIPSAIYVGIIASIFVIATDYKSLNIKLLFPKTVALAFFGTLIGVSFFNEISTDLLLKIFAIFLIIISIKSLYFSNKETPPIFQSPLLFSGGLMQGLYGVGGPFTLLAIKDSFANKSELRATMAFYFIIFNILRIIQFHFTKVIHVKEIFINWWLAIPIFIAVFIGFNCHLKISEAFFKKAINFLLLGAGLIYLFK